MSRTHHHPIRDQRGLASVEHEDHPGQREGHPHLHEAQPELGPSTREEPMLRRMKAMAARAGVTLRMPERPN